MNNGTPPKKGAAILRVKVTETAATVQTAQLATQAPESVPKRDPARGPDVLGPERCKAL